MLAGRGLSWPRRSLFSSIFPSFFFFFLLQRNFYPNNSSGYRVSLLYSSYESNHLGKTRLTPWIPLLPLWNEFTAKINRGIATTPVSYNRNITTTRGSNMSLYVNTKIMNLTEDNSIDLPSTYAARLHYAFALLFTFSNRANRI